MVEGAAAPSFLFLSEPKGTVVCPVFYRFVEVGKTLVNPQRFFDGKEKARINELSKWIST
jgi:hypothetical protein